MGDRVFNFQVETRPTGTIKHQVKRAQFGEGYVQKDGNGLNGKFGSWNVTVDSDYADVQEVRDFLDDHAGYLSFLWTPPNYPGPLRFTCETYSEVPHVGTQEKLTAVFEQVYFP